MWEYGLLHMLCVASKLVFALRIRIRSQMKIDRQYHVLYTYILVPGGGFGWPTNRITVFLVLGRCIEVGWIH